MSSGKEGYLLLSQSHSDSDDFEHDGIVEQGHETNSTGPRGNRFSFMWISLLVSVALNLLLVVHVLTRDSRRLSDGERTAYARITRDVPTSYIHDSPYDDNRNQSGTDFLWEHLSIDPGAVALSDDFAARTGLPKAQRFPWDDTKGIYLLTGFHNLHCLIIIRTSAIEFNRSLPQTYRFSHVTHCLDGIRQTIMCDADDTPRYTTNDGNPTSGVGQIRMCRSWEAMERWAVQNSACWSYVDPSNWDTDMIRRYKYCPPESPYWEKVRDYFGDSTLGNESLKTSYDMGWGKSIDV